MSQLFKKKAEPQPAVPQQREFSDAYKTLRADYVALCAHKTSYPLKQAEEDFDTLAAHERVQLLTINLEKKCLYIATTKVIVPDEGKRRYVGQFICTLSREDNFFQYENIDNPLGKHSDTRVTVDTENDTVFVITTQNEGFDDGFDRAAAHPHPHIDKSGAMCMPDGEVQVHEALVRGDLLTAGIIAVDALFFFEGNPYLAVCNWPLYEGDEDA